MKLHDFTEVDSLEFARCQRPDGTFYGTGGVCRKGTSVGPKEIKALKKAAEGGNERAAKALAKVEGKAPAETPKKPDDYQKGGKFVGQSSNEARDSVKKLYQDQIDNADKFLKKDPDDEFAKFQKENATRMMQPIVNSEKLVDGVTSGVPEGTEVGFKSNGFLYTKAVTPGGTEVTTSFGQGTFNFQVNGSYDAGSVTDRREQMAVARQVQRAWKAHKNSLPKGYVVEAIAWGEDGRGASRIRAYERMGFSKPVSGSDANPGPQFGRIGSKGSVSPSNRSEQSTGSTLLTFAEESNAKDVALWFVAVFGVEKGKDFSESLDFARCQRPDGTHYGTGGVCRKGTPVGAKEKKPLKERFKKGEEIGAGAYGAVVATKEGTVIKKGFISEAEIQIAERLEGVDGVPKVLGHEFLGKTTDDKYDPVKGLIEMETAKGLPLGEQTLSKKDQAKAIDEYIRLRKEMHMKGVAHNDFHDNNFFYDKETGKGGAIDFGLSKMSRREALREALGTGRMEMDIQSHFLMQGMPTTPTLKRLNENIARTQLKMLGEGYSDLDVIRGNTTVAEAKSFVNDIYKGI